MIWAERREGQLQEAPDPRTRVAPLWRNLDRNIPLWVKLAVPVVAITLAGTMVFGLVLAQRAQSVLEDSYVVSATATAQASSTDFYTSIGSPTEVNSYLSAVASAQPDVQGIWIVDIGRPGSPVVASSVSTDMERTGLIDSTDVQRIESGASSLEQQTVDGKVVLDTLIPVRGNAFAVLIRTSLDGETAAVSQIVLFTAISALVVCLVEIAALLIILNAGVLSRIRRVRNAVESFGRDHRRNRLAEGFEPEGRDVLFNLARRVDAKLVELSEHERAGDVVSELGLLALQGAKPPELTRKALELTRHAAGLDRCFLVETTGTSVVVDSFETAGGQTAEAKLPVWLGALVRSTTQTRRPILADSLGQGSRFWAAGSEDATAAAAFVPLPGTPSPIGVMVGIAPAGSEVSAVSVALMEAVATALGESLQRSEADKAKHESEVKSKALSTVSHEMRNPLNAMLGFSNLLLSGAAGPLNAKQESYVRHVDDASHHLLRLVNDYLDLARVMAGSLPLEPEAVQVAPEVESVLGMLRPMADAKNVALRAEASPDAVAHADRTRLRQVLMNLVSNAIRFTPARGHVRVEVAGGSNGVRISVIDTGAGIPADRQHLVFTEFAQLRPDGNSGGAGLGLSLTKRFVEAMGGFIRFTSSEGAGTIFDVWLPGEQTPRPALHPGIEAAPVKAADAA